MTQLNRRVNPDIVKPCINSALTKQEVFAHVLPVLQLEVEEGIQSLVVVSRVLMRPLRMVFYHLQKDLLMDHHKASGYALGFHQTHAIHLHTTILIVQRQDVDLALLPRFITTGNDGFILAPCQQPQNRISFKIDVSINEQQMIAV